MSFVPSQSYIDAMERAGRKGDGSGELLNPNPSAQSTTTIDTSGNIPLLQTDFLADAQAGLTTKQSNDARRAAWAALQAENQETPEPEPKPKPTPTPGPTPPGEVVPITRPLPNLAEPVTYEDDRKFAATPDFQKALTDAQAPFMPEERTEDNDYIFVNQDATNRAVSSILTAYDSTGGWDPFYDMSKASTSQNLNPSGTPFNQEELMQQINQSPQVARNRAKLSEAAAFGPNFNDLS